MTDSYKPLLAAAIAALKADSTLTAIVGNRIYNDVPDNPTFPFVVVTIDSGVYDTKTSAGMEHTMTCAMFSRKTSSEQIGDIRAAIYNLFHRQESALTSASVDNIIFNGLAPTFKEPDGQTWQGVIQFRVVIGE